VALGPNAAEAVAVTPLGRAAWAVTVAILLLLLFLPAAVVVLFAFNSGANLSWPPQGFGLRWFRYVAGDPEFQAALRNSLTAAFWTSLIDLLVGAAAAFGIVRHRSLFSRWLEGASRLPVLVPPLILGLGLAGGMKWFDVEPSMATVIAGHVVVTVPFVLLILIARLREYDVNIDHAARDLGASPAEVLRRVTWPLVAPSVLGAVIVAAAISLDEVLVTNFTSGTTPTMPLFVLSRMRRTIDPSINVVATLLLAAPWLALLAWALISRGARRANPLRDLVGGRP